MRILIFSFYLTSTIIQFANPINTIIKIKIYNWVSTNWQKWSSTSSYTWLTWNIGYYLKNGSCIIDASSTSIALTLSLQILIGIAALLVFLMTIANISSQTSFWALINQMQMFFLLLLTRAFIPSDVQEVITGLKFSLNPFNYFSFKSSSSYGSSLEYFNFHLSDDRFDSVGLDSDSTLYNTYSFFIVTAMIIPLQILIFILYKLLSNRLTSGKCSWLTKVTKWILNKSYRFLTLGYFIRNFLEMSQYLLICSIYEIYTFNNSESLRIVSLSFAFLVLILCISINIFIFYLSFSSYIVNKDKHNILEEFLDGIKMDRKFKMYSAMHLLRKIIYIAFLIALVWISSRILIGILTVFQIGYLIYVAVLRPFTELKLNVIEIMNEIYFLILLSSLIYLNTEQQWISICISVYMWTLASNSFLIFLIVMGKEF